ncbi:MAG: hypothetical protein HPY72_11975 [Anaerolineae bacterium]|jgi:predicted ATPase with chaperone activity|nr:hypothetical protein [Anaerolineae bacterium]
MKLYYHIYPVNSRIQRSQFFTHKLIFGESLRTRTYPLILKLARTIADLDHSGDIQNTHLAEALQYWPQMLL